MKISRLLILIAAVSAAAVWNCFRQSDHTSAATKETSYTQKKTISANADSLLHVTLPRELPSQIKEYTGFTLSFNRNNHTPNYVAWELLPEETEGQISRSDKFWQDPEIDGCPTTADYVRSGYDRGHLCPAADQKWSIQAMTDCFVMANICPQDHNLNAGAWATLEKRERRWAAQAGGMIIIAGPIYTDRDTQTIGQTHVRIPSAFFKVMLTHRAQSPAAIAAVYPNMPAHGNMTDYFMTVDQLEEITGYDFFHTLPDDIENAIEATFNPKEWK